MALVPLLRVTPLVGQNFPSDLWSKVNHAQKTILHQPLPVVMACVESTNAEIEERVNVYKLEARTRIQHDSIRREHLRCTSPQTDEYLARETTVIFKDLEIERP